MPLLPQGFLDISRGVAIVFDDENFHGWTQNKAVFSIHKTCKPRRSRDLTAF
jgi:hypothetical protein